MTESWLEAGVFTLQWLTMHPWICIGLLVSLQVAVVAAAAAAAARLFAGAERQIHRVWISAVVLSLVVIPVHMTAFGWPINVAISAPISSQATVTEFEAGQSQAEKSSPLPDDARRGTALPGPPVVAEASEGSAAVANDPAVGDHANVFHDSVLIETRTEPANTAITSPSLLIETSDTVSTWTRAAVFVGVIYLAGCVVVIARLLIGRSLLIRWTRGGDQLDPLSARDADAIASGMGLFNPPRVVVSQRIAMPLVFGIARPTVLVPGDFPSWTFDERRATLLHEFMHVRRRDAIGHWLSKLMRVIYWFHPACWFMDRRLTEAREWATDRDVILCGGQPGMQITAEQYARCLLSIVARVGSQARNLAAAGITMSAGGKMEDRLRRILLETPRSRATQWLLAPLSIALLMVLTALTTTRLEPLAAQDVQESSPPVNAESKSSPGSDDGAEGNSDEPETLAVPTASEDSDLVYRIANCKVLSVAGEESGPVFTVSGQVVSADGDPVSGAVVVLRESSTDRISSQYQKYLQVEDRHLVRVPDVFARTTTDNQGEFQFSEAKSPALPDGSSRSWAWDVVAAHREHGVGWFSLRDTKEKQRVESDLTLTLEPTVEISGRFVSPRNSEIQDATLSLYRLVKPARYPRSGDDLDLQMSQLAPRVETDEQGQFKLTGIPQSMVVLLSVFHFDWVQRGAAIATSEDVPTGQVDGEHLHDQEVLASPAKIVADPGILLKGKVIDTDQNPIEDVKVSYSSSIDRTPTDANGEFEIRLSSKSIERDQKRGTTSRIYVFAEKESGFLPTLHEEPIENITAENPVTIELEKGVLVSGKVVTQEGEAVAEAVLRPVSDSTLLGGKTETDGSYEFLVARRSHVILVGTDEPGYALPKRRDLYRYREVDDAARRLPHISVDASDGNAKQVEPFVVEKVKPIQVIVSLPSGQPAVGATAIIKDEIPSQPRPNSNFKIPPRIVDKSKPTTTNTLGRADLFPQGVPSEQAFVEVKQSVGESAYDASVPLEQAVDGVLHVVLTPAWLVEGRVLVDGQPIPGARVSIGQSKSHSANSGGSSMGFTVVSNHIQVTTDAEGWYRAAVPAGKTYSVSLQSLPDDPEASPGVGYRPTPAGERKLRVKDFSFTRGESEVAGRVIDPQGRPVVGAQVRVMRQSDVSPGFWLGHMSESQQDTDQNGHFHLKRVPTGTYRLSVRGPRGKDNRRGASTMVTAETGNMDLEVILNAQPKPEIPRLTPKRIVPIRQETIRQNSNSNADARGRS